MTNNPHVVETRPSLLYVAGAYSGDIARNIAKAEMVSLDLIRHGFHVITPHKNTAGYEKYEGDGLSEQTWLDMDINILSRCDGIYILDNWRTSKGANKEIQFALMNDIPIYWEELCPPHELNQKLIR